MEIINYLASSVESEEYEKKYYDDCLWKVYKNYLNCQIKKLTDEYSTTIDGFRKKEISSEIQQINKKIISKKVDEL